jgi:hypothetical protein
MSAIALTLGFLRSQGRGWGVGQMNCYGFNFQTAAVKHSFAISPHHSREFCFEFPALKTEGAGNAGRPERPQPRVVCSKHAR